MYAPPQSRNNIFYSLILENKKKEKIKKLNKKFSLLTWIIAYDVDDGTFVNIIKDSETPKNVQEENSIGIREMKILW